MHSSSASPSSEFETVSPGPERCVTYPENTVFSLLVIALISAGALYVVQWSLREEVVPVRQWDFATMAESEGPWAFPDANRVKTASGMAFEIEGTGPGPILTMAFDAATVRKIRTTIAVTSVGSGLSVPFTLEWYWSSPSQVAEAAGNWPFSTDRGAAFYQPDRHDAELRQVDIHEHHFWKGPVAKAFIGVKFTSAVPGPFRVETKKIEFLE